MNVTLPDPAPPYEPLLLAARTPLLLLRECVPLRCLKILSSGTFDALGSFTFLYRLEIGVEIPTLDLPADLDSGLALR